MDEFNEPVEVLGSDSFVLLVEIVDIAIQNLNKKFDGHGSVHASVCDAEGPLEAFQNPLSITVKLLRR